MDALFDSHIATILARFEPHEPFEIISALGLRNAVADTERDEDRAEISFVAAGELGVAVCVSSGLPRVVAARAPTETPGEAAWSVHEMLIACVFMSLPSAADEPGALDAHTRFAAQAGVIRYDRFDHQELEQIEALLGPDHIAEWCRRAVGFDAAQAVTIYNAIADQYEAVYARAFATRNDPTPGLGNDLTLIAADLSRNTGLPESVINAFVATFAVSLGELPLPRRTSDLTVIRRRPLVRDGDKVICTLPSNLLRAIRPALEAGLKLAANGLEAYQRNRGRYSERRAVSLLADFLRPDLALTGLSFGSGDTAGELDALIVVDDTALIVEVKSGAVRSGGQRQRTAGFEGTIKDLIEYPIRQIERTRSALLAGQEFRDAKGPLTIPFGQVKRVYGVIVTLEPLAFAGPMLWQLEDEGLLQPDGPLPWLVALHELESICQILEFPAQLLHFLDAHQRMDALRCVYATDEIDVLMAYLDIGLRFSWLPPAERIILPADSDQLNTWMLYKLGIRQAPAPRPKQYFPMPVRLETIARLRRLDVDRAAGFVADSFAVIDSALDEADAERGPPIPAS
jgi:hypothetical protein